VSENVARSDELGAIYPNRTLTSAMPFIDEERKEAAADKLKDDKKEKADVKEKKKKGGGGGGTTIYNSSRNYFVLSGNTLNITFAADRTTAFPMGGPKSDYAQTGIPERGYEKGKKIFKQRCSQCHELTSLSTTTDPSLNAVVGLKSGQVPGFGYSAVNKNEGVTWTRETLFDYLKGPKKCLPGTNGLRWPQAGIGACGLDQVHRS